MSRISSPTSFPGLPAGIAVAGLLALAAPLPAPGATLAVTNCNDSGAGSLRAQVAAAASGDTVDLRGLSCGYIRLTSEIAIPQASLTLRGPGWRGLLVDAFWNDSVLRHTGTGTLRLRGLSIVHGNREAQRALGGCVYTAGNFDAYDVDIGHCGAHGLGTPPTAAMGGAVYAAGNMSITYSGVHDSSAHGGSSFGGILYAGGKLTLKRVRVSAGNARIGGGVYVLGGLSLDTVTFTRNLSNQGGAINASGAASIRDSAIVQNTGNGPAAGLWLYGTGDKLIVNSTVSGNRGPVNSAGVVAGSLLLANSTVAYNQSFQCDGALRVADAHLESSILANDVCGDVDFDPQPDRDLTGADASVPVTGSDNLVMSSNLTLPADTIGADPLLAPLADNGGRTLTHALMAGSQALDAGNNAAGLAYDQRGVGFPRVKNGRADIGAFER